MALNATQFQQWLEDPSAIRCLLVVAQYNDGGPTDTTVYFSNRNYIADSTGKPGEIPANTFFNPIVGVGLEYTESISLDGSASISFGDLSIDNTNGVNDSYLEYVWANRPIQVYIGDPLKHSTDDFTKIYSGYVSDIGAKDVNSINLRLRDFMQRFNCPITEATIENIDPTIASGLIPGYTYTFSASKDKDTILPLVFGEVFNISPLLIDPNNVIYMVNNGPIERVIEVRDNGMPLTEGTNYNVDLTKGIIYFLTMPAGAVTCSVQGVKVNTGTYSNKVSDIIKYILKTHGNDVLTDSDLDLTTFNTFSSTYTQPVGIFIQDKSNVIDVCQQLASSIGAQVVATRSGKISLIRLDIPSAGSKIINDEDILQGSLAVSEKLEVVCAVKLAYAKNWTIQEGLVTGIPSAHKEEMAKEWLNIESIDSAVQNKYKISNKVEAVPTLMITDSGLQVTNEAERRLNMRKVPRFIYEMECTPKAITLQLGEMITLQYYRFGMSSGKYGQVVSISTNWDSGITRLGVFI